MRSAFVIALIVTCLAGIAFAKYVQGQESWVDRKTVSQRTRICRGKVGQESWVDRDFFTRCETCNSRCYMATFNATAETTGSPAGLCHTTGDVCTITLLVRTAPCCDCWAGTEIVDLYVNEEGEEIEIVTTESSCEVSQFTVLVNGYWTLPLDGGCNSTSEPYFQQSWTADDSTTNSISDCQGSSNSGSALNQAYKDSYRNGRYPDPCFADKNWIDSYTSTESGLITSFFKMYRPGSNAVWFDVPLIRRDALRQVGCKTLPTEIVTYVPPV